jgi:glutathione peroxidase
MSIYDHQLNALDGTTLDLHDYEDKALLIVNVASKCGLTPQYTGLEKIHEQYSEKGFSVLGVPCNQFMGQEPGTSEEIATFCSVNYGVTFPLAEKVEVNGEGQHPLYAELTAVPDSEGKDGDVAWNFEKFLVAPGGAVTRFRPQVEPEDPALVGALEAALPG